jgi:ABC-type Fe3+/spermidine/putrescine transport system ATPase subunit
MSRWVAEGIETDLDHFHLGPVNLDVGPGKAVAVLGPSGAGKTTLLRTLAGFLPLHRGRFLRDGEEIAHWLPEERRLGYVPQGLGLFPHRTVTRNIRYPMELREGLDVEGRTRALLQRFHLTPLADRYPARLSGGEQQRVALARALAAEPELILWDEPWQALDVLARHELGEILHDLRETEGVPVIVVTHDPALAFSIADSFVVLEAGRGGTPCDAATLLRAPTDAFVARFVGFENVYKRADLEVARSPSLASWLLEHAGRGGVAFSTPGLPGDGRVLEISWEGIVRSARPGPYGITVEVMSGDLLVTLRVPPPVSPPLPALGQRVHFGIDPASVHPLGGDSDRHTEGRWPDVPAR